MYFLKSFFKIVIPLNPPSKATVSLKPSFDQTCGHKSDKSQSFKRYRCKSDTVILAGGSDEISITVSLTFDRLG